jgi:hypothetical protein
MIKDFCIEDLGYFMPNEFSNPDAVLDVLTDETVTRKTLWRVGMVDAILVYREYWPQCWSGFVLVSDSIHPLAAIELRAFMRQAIVDHNAIRFQTDSVAHEVLDKWHRFLGFQLEGRRVKMMRGVDYHSWAIIRQGEA